MIKDLTRNHSGYQLGEGGRIVGIWTGRAGFKFGIGASLSKWGSPRSLRVDDFSPLLPHSKRQCLLQKPSGSWTSALARRSPALINLCSLLSVLVMTNFDFYQIESICYWGIL